MTTPAPLSEKPRDLNDEMHAAASGRKQLIPTPGNTTRYQYDAKRVDVNKVKELIALGADPLSVDAQFGRTIGHWGAFWGRMELVTLYHETHHGNINALSTEPSHHSIGSVAASYARPDVLAYFYDNGGTNHEPRGWTIGHAAAVSNDDEHAQSEERSIRCLQLYLDHGGNFTTTTNEGKTAAMYAAMVGKPKTLDFIFNHGGDANAQDAKGWTVGHHSIHAIDQAKAVLDVYQKHGGRMDAKTNQGHTVEQILKMHD